MIEYQNTIVNKNDHCVYSVVPLDDMKAIINKSLKNASNYVEFYTGIINGVYELGVNHGLKKRKED